MPVDPHNSPSTATGGSDDRPRDLSEQFQQGSGGYELVISAVILGLFGLWLDRRWGTTPVLAIGFTVAGFVGAAASIYYRYRWRIDQLAAEAEELRAAARRRNTPSPTSDAPAVETSGPTRREPRP